MIHELSNPITKSLIAALRDENSDALRVRHIVKEITKQLLYEALKESPLVLKNVKTWKGENSFEAIAESNIVVVTVLRAGMPMLDSIMEVLPKISAGFLAMKRDEDTHKSVLYYDRLPECRGKTILLVDPMLATGGSMCDALDVIKSKDVSKVIALNIIGSPQGLQTLSSKHPDVDIYISQIDEFLNDDKFIIPGIGDAGDRSYNTL